MLAATLLAVGCAPAPAPSTPILTPTSGISRDEAVAAAQSEGYRGNLVSAELGNAAGFPTAPELATSWIVRFHGDYEAPCPVVPTGPAPDCPILHGLTVVIDRFNGEFVMATYE